MIAATSTHDKVRGHYPTVGLADGGAANPEGALPERIQTAAERFPLFDGKALNALDCRVDYLIHNLLVAGQPCIVAGPKKSLKTGTLIDMSISLASGAPCLNNFAVPMPRSVLLMTGESGEGTIQTSRILADSSATGATTPRVSQITVACADVIVSIRGRGRFC